MVEYAMVTFMGTATLRTVVDRGATGHDPPFHLNAGQAVRVEGGGPWRCKGCSVYKTLPSGKVYMGKERPDQCDNLLTTRVRKMNRVTMETGPCPSPGFDGDLDIEYFKVKASMDGECWKVKPVEARNVIEKMAEKLGGKA